MSSEKTEKATPKRREDARRKGQIARGAELPAALGFFGSLLAINVLGSEFFKKISISFHTSAEKIFYIKTLDVPDIQQLFVSSAKLLVLLVVPIMLVGMAASLSGNFAQGGFLLNFEALTPKIERFDPTKNIKQIFGPDALINLLKSSIKLIFIGAVTYTVLLPVIDNAPMFLHLPKEQVALKLGETLYSLAFRCGFVLLLIACADYGWVWYKHEKSLRMSKQEIRDEYKQSEGDPMIKSQRRRAARALVQKRSLAEVPSASVVITNPTHFAVALRYDRDRDAAPIVVAKGADNLAAKIREIAKENDIPLVENPPLARALFRTVEINQIIPAEFFGAVAEILAFVFRGKES